MEPSYQLLNYWIAESSGTPRINLLSTYPESYFRRNFRLGFDHYTGSFGFDVTYFWSRLRSYVTWEVLDWPIQHMMDSMSKKWMTTLSTLYWGRKYQDSKVVLVIFI